MKTKEEINRSVLAYMMFHNKVKKEELLSVVEAHQTHATLDVPSVSEY